MKDLERAKLVNPYTTERVKDKTAERDAEEAVSWKPKFSTFTGPQAGSAVAMAMAKQTAWPQQRKCGGTGGRGARGSRPATASSRS